MNLNHVLLWLLVLSLNSYSLSIQSLYLPAVFLAFSSTTSPHFMFLAFLVLSAGRAFFTGFQLLSLYSHAGCIKQCCPSLIFDLKVLSDPSQMKSNEEAMLTGELVCGGVVLSLCDWEVWGVKFDLFLTTLGFQTCCARSGNVQFQFQFVLPEH